MPQLQQHMLRVTAVAVKICENLEPDLSEQEKTDITYACLFHDVANILKFDLKQFPEFLEPHGLDYWQHVQSDLKEKYGSDEHQVSMKIAQEIGFSDRVIDLIECIDFTTVQETWDSKDIGKMICEYSDDRVTPFGIVSLEQRLADLENRYGAKYPSQEDRAKRQEFASYVRHIEKFIFAQTPLNPEDINDQSCQAFIDPLLKLEIAI